MSEEGDVGVGDLVVRLTGESSGLDAVAAQSVARANQTLTQIHDARLQFNVTDLSNYSRALTSIKEQTAAAFQAPTVKLPPPPTPPTAPRGWSAREVYDSFHWHKGQAEADPTPPPQPPPIPQPPPAPPVPPPPTAQSQAAAERELRNKQAADARLRQEELRSGDELARIHAELENATINATQTGRARELALLEASHRQEREYRLRHGHDITVTDRTAEQERLAFHRQAAEEDARIAGVSAQRQGQEKQQQVEEQARLQNELENATIRASHTGREQSFRLLQARHRQERDERLRQGQDTTVTDQIAQQREAAFNRDNPEEHQGHISHYLARRLAYHAGAALSIAGLSNQTTLLMTEIEAFGKAGSLITVGLAFAEMYGKIRQRAIDLSYSQMDLNAELRKSVVEWNNVAAAQAPSNSTSSMARTRSSEAGDRWRDIKLENDKKIMEMNRRTLGFSSLDVWSVAFEQVGDVATGGKGRFEDTTFGQQQSIIEGRIASSKDQEERLHAVALQAEHTQIIRNRADRANAEEAAHIAGMYESPAKRRLALENTAIKEHQKLVNDNEDKTNNLRVAQREAMVAALTNVNQTGDVFSHAKNGPAGSTEYEDYERKWEAYRDAQAALKKLKDEQKTTRGDLAADNAGAILSQEKEVAEKRKALEKDIVEEGIKNQNSLANARISTFDTSDARDLHMMQARHQQEAAQRQRVIDEMIANKAPQKDIDEQRQLNEPLDKQAAVEEAGARHQIVLQGIKDQNELQNARITLATTGYARERALLIENHAQERRARAENIGWMQQNGVSPAVIAEQKARDAVKDQTAAVQEATQAKEHQYQIATSLQEMTEKTLVATKQITPAAAEWLAMQRQLTHELGYTPAQLAAAKAAFDKLKEAEALAPIILQIAHLGLDLDQLKHRGDTATYWADEFAKLKLDHPEIKDGTEAMTKLKEQLEKVRGLANFKFQLGTEDMKIDLDLIHQKITQAEADLAKLKLANPGVDPKELQARADQMKQNRAAEFAHEERNRLDPRRQLGEYSLHLKEALDAGEVSAKEAKEMLLHKVQEIWGSAINPGKFQAFDNATVAGGITKASMWNTGGALGDMHQGVLQDHFSGWHGGSSAFEQSGGGRQRNVGGQIDIQAMNLSPTVGIDGRLLENGKTLIGILGQLTELNKKGLN